MTLEEDGRNAVKQNRPFHLEGPVNRNCYFLIAAVALLALVPSSAAANHPATGQGNDQRSSPFALGEPDAQHTDSNASPPAGTETGEPLTPTGPGYCGANGEFTTNPAGAAEMGATLWYRVTGTGGPITVSTRRSTFDTVIAVYRASDLGFVRCDDDGNSFGAGESELVFNSTAAAQYLVQVGGFVSGGQPARGSVGIDVFRPPLNDNRAAAQAVTSGTATPADNLGATLEAGEGASCEGSSYGKTVWFRWVAPATGTAVFGANAVGMDTVLAAYAGGAGAPIGCSDDAVGSATSSRLARRVQAGQTYFIQVGGFRAPDSGVQAADDGAFNFTVEFTRDAVDLDGDNDGANRPADCNDANPNIRPGAVDVPRNGVDENCDGRDANLPVMNSPEVVCSPVFSRRRGLIGVSFCRVRAVPPGTSVRISCRGRGCRSPRSRSRTVRSGSAGVSFRRLVKRRFGRVTLTITATRSGYIGHYVRYSLSRGSKRRRLARTVRCIEAGRRPFRCPTG